MRPDLIEEAREAGRLLETAAVFVQLGWTTNANARMADGTPLQPRAAGRGVLVRAGRADPRRST